VSFTLVFQERHAFVTKSKDIAAAPMDFDAWTNRTADRQRARRLLLGYVIGLVTLLSFGTALALTSHKEVAEEEEENVQNVLLAAEPEPEPEPEAAEPEPVDPNPAPAQPRGPVMPTLAVPTEIPSDAPAETAPANDYNPYASGDPYQYATQGRVARAAPAVVKAASPEPAAAPIGPSRVTADTTPPQKLSGAAFTYPAAAKAAGIEGKVIVKFVVKEDGSVTDIQVVKGPDALRDAVIEMVKSYKFTPALRGGQPVSVIQTKVFNFKLTT
jgi:periplasmic protein TonB